MGMEVIVVAEMWCWGYGGGDIAVKGKEELLTFGSGGQLRHCSRPQEERVKRWCGCSMHFIECREELNLPPHQAS